VMFKPNIFVFVLVFLLAVTVDISEAKGRGGGRGGRRGSSGGGIYLFGLDFMTFLYVILGIIGFCILLWVLYKCLKLAEDNDYQENYTNQTERNIQSKFELNPTAVNNSKLMAQPNNVHWVPDVYSQNKRQENNFNSAAINMPSNPEYNNFPSNFQTNTNWLVTPSRYSLGRPSGNQNEKQENNFNSAAIDMPAKPEYEARNNFPSSIQANAYGANNHTTPSNNIPYSLGEPIGNQNERQENDFNPGFNPGFNPAFNPTFNPAAIEMPPNPEYEARNNFPSNFQTNNFGANNHMTSASNLPYSLSPHWMDAI